VGLEPAKYLRGDFKTHVAVILLASDCHLQTLNPVQISLQEIDACV
jgi:hypothetical protein